MLTIGRCSLKNGMNHCIFMAKSNNIFGSRKTGLNASMLVALLWINDVNKSVFFQHFPVAFIKWLVGAEVD